MINTLAKTAMPAILLVGCHSTQLLETEQNVLNQTIEATSLTTQLANSLSLSNTQFIGGSAALLSLAQNTLNEHNQQELNTLIPSLPILGYAQDLTKSLDSMEEVQSTFSQLGLNTNTISQLSPVLLDLLGQNGASAELLESLVYLWL